MGNNEIIIDLACTYTEKELNKDVKIPPITGTYSRQVTYIVINDVAYMNRIKIKKDVKQSCCKQVLVTRSSFNKALDEYLERHRTFQVFCGSSLYKHILCNKFDVYRMNMFFRLDTPRNFGTIEMIDHESNDCVHINTFYNDDTPYAKLIKRAKDEGKLLCVARYIVESRPVCKWKMHNIYNMSKIVSLDIILPDEYYAEYTKEYNRVETGR